jgi:tRNA G10  N-methylase Trm11
LGKCVGDQQNILTNFSYFSLRNSELLLADSTTLCFRQQQYFFDAVICDPPFGFLFLHSFDLVLMTCEEELSLIDAIL